VGEPLPLSVWPVAQQTSRVQRAGRYLEVSGAHPAKMLPAIARRCIEDYSSPGDIVVDPMCGVGTTLVEAMHLGRDAVGVEYESRWAEMASANVAHATACGASGHGEVLCGDGRSVSALVDPALRGLVALVVTSPPYGPSLHGKVRTAPGRGVAKFDCSYSRDPANLAAVGPEELLAAIRDILAGSARLRPGGIVAMTLRPWRQRGELVDLPGAVGQVGEDAGLVLLERNVALLVGLRHEALVPRASFFAMDQARRARRRGFPQLVIAHEDVVVLRKA
jgi:modification methylase